MKFQGFGNDRLNIRRCRMNHFQIDFNQVQDLTTSFTGKQATISISKPEGRFFFAGRD